MKKCTSSAVFLYFFHTPVSRSIWIQLRSNKYQNDRIDFLFRLIPFISSHCHSFHHNLLQTNTPQQKKKKKKKIKKKKKNLAAKFFQTPISHLIPLQIQPFKHQNAPHNLLFPTVSISPPHSQHPPRHPPRTRTPPAVSPPASCETPRQTPRVRRIWTLVE
jgi:hypothetical protein